ncbi:MAG: hypothetical protein ACD_2C00018G0001, partial [uncultured bacterium (gcode 4)]
MSIMPQKDEPDESEAHDTNKLKEKIPLP